MRVFVSLALILFVIILSCNDSVEVESRKNELNGITKRRINRESKSATDSVFDALGNLKKIVEYYCDNELRKKKVSYYKNGTQDSTMLDFYYNGNLKSKRFYFSGKECFERIDFNEDGKISKYIFLNSDQTKFYIRLYDNAGFCIGVRGIPFFESYMYRNTNSVFSTKDTVSTLFYVPNPPDCIVKLYTVQKEIEINNISALPAGFIYGVKIYPLEIGNYEWQIRMKVFDKKNDSIIYSSKLTELVFVVK